MTKSKEKATDSCRNPVVFISSTVEDLSLYRKAACDAVLRAGCMPVMQEYFAAQSEYPPLEACLRKVDQCDLLVVIVAYRHGWTPADQPLLNGKATFKSITRLECERCLSAGKEVLAFLVDSSYAWPMEQREEGRVGIALQKGGFTQELSEEVQRNMASLKEFKSWLSGIGFRETFTTPDSLSAKLVQALNDWKTRHKFIRPDTGHTPHTDRSVFQSYLDSALAEHRYLPIKGFVTNFRASIAIKNIYVNMRARVHATEFDYTMEGMRKLKEFEEREQLSDLDLKAALRAAEKRNIKDLVILGKPGSGKTTLLKYILVTIVEGKAEDTIGLDSALIPLFAPLRELRDPGKQDFVAFMMQQCKLADFAIAADDFRALLETGRAIVLLDGLDEVADADMRLATCRWIDKARSRFARTRFFVTSRYAGYFGESRLEGNLLELAIQDFNLQEIEQFLHYWFETIELLLHPAQDDAYWRKQAAAEASDLFANIKKNPHVQALAVNPLMLQIIACIRKDRGTVLPERRVELYQECVEVFLERWDLAKNIPVVFRGREARAILQPLALWLHEKENRRAGPHL